jgi:hypothetical protein
VFELQVGGQEGHLPAQPGLIRFGDFFDFHNDRLRSGFSTG